MVRSAFLENGTVIEQETEYNNVTKEVKIQVRVFSIVYDGYGAGHMKKHCNSEGQCAGQYI